MKGLLKLGPRAAWGALCFCSPDAPNAGWGVTPKGRGKGGFELDPQGTVNVEVGLEMPDDSAGWFVVPRAEAGRRLPIPLKLALFLLGDI